MTEESELESTYGEGGIEISDFSLFSVTTLRSKIVYPNLADHKFSTEGKLEFLDLAYEAVESGQAKTLAAFGELYKIPARTIGDWNNRRKRGELLHSNNCT